jgi:hypothetical protein
MDWSGRQVSVVRVEGAGPGRLADQHARQAPRKTKDAVELAILEWAHRFNNHRLLQPIGFVPPAEA